MKSILALVLATLVGSSSGAAVGDGHPIEKVIKMLKGLSTTAETEGKKEALLYEKFEYWCKKSLNTLGKAIDGETDSIEMLEDKIKAKKAQSVSLKEDTAELAKSIDDSEAAAGKAAKIRKETAALYEKANKDYESTIKAVASAIKELGDSKKGGALLALSANVRTALALAKASSTDEAERGMLSALLQKPKRPNFEAKGDYEKHKKTYDFKSGNVIELFKELKLKFEDDKTAATKDETNSLNAYELEKKARDGEIAAAKASKDENTKILGKVEKDLVQLKSDLKSTQEDKEADTKSLGDTKKACTLKAREWDERSQVRKQEIEAMAMAVKILAKVSGVRTEAPDNPGLPASPLKEGSSLLSIGIRSFLQISEDPAQKAINLLRATALVTHSKVLERIAQQISLNKGAPFNKVINMIEKMIFRLMDEQTSEDKHKNWCDKELSEAEKSKSDKEDKIKEVGAEIKKLSGTIQSLVKDIEAAQKMIAKITGFMREATEIRVTGKKENREAIKDSQVAQDAVAQATSVLETFYKESGMIEKKPYELVQKPVKLPDDPKTWDSSYTGVADPKNAKSGVVSVLKAVATDFAKMEADTRAQEATDQQAYDKEMSSSKIEKARRATENDMKSAEKKRLVEDLEQKKKSKKHVSAELEAVAQYLADLKPACVTGDSSYEDRKKARKKEIDALRKAQDTLQDAFKEKKEEKKFMLTQLKKTSSFLHSH
jgi:DNA repair exonuclease SbcCD ATPase subunit